eukprot:1380239-Heterocapsa_arctica.AAC.1
MRTVDHLPPSFFVDEVAHRQSIQNSSSPRQARVQGEDAFLRSEPPSVRDLVGADQHRLAGDALGARRLG